MNKCTKCKADVSDAEFKYRKRICLECFRKDERARGQIYYEKNKARINADRMKLKEGRQAEINAYQRAQYRKNHVSYRTAINAKWNDRYNGDTTFRIMQCLKKNMLNYFDKKGKHAYSFIGCSQDMLNDWLRWQCDITGLQFSDHGNDGWHIDHVVPCASFNLEDPVQQQTCYNWTNLRPLPALENISKSDSIDITAIRMQEVRVKAYLFTKGKYFDSTDYTVGTVLATTLRKQLRLGTRGNDLGQVWRLLQQAALYAVKTPETRGQSAAKLLHILINYTLQLEKIRELVQLCRL